MEAPNQRLLHFLVDGFTAFGAVWYRGQEIEIDEKTYNDTVNREGKSWIDLTAKEQMKKFGAQMFAEGPWPFDEFDDETARKAEASRGRRPRI